MRTAAGVKLDLEPVAALLRLLGDPQQAGLRFVVVAGTNGKGSVAAMTAAALKAAGHRVGLFTSPHLLRFTERIRIDGREASRAEIVEIYGRICEVEAQCPRAPTYFECVTAMALCLFAEAGVEVGVLEVGLGGRLDATNVVANDLAVITPVDLDHQHLLGDTVDLIAAEKGAIIAPDRPVVVAPQSPAAQAVIERIARERGAETVPAAAWTETDAGLVMRDGAESLVLHRPPSAPYLRHNLATAWTACRRLDQMGIRCSNAAFTEAAGSFVWPGRYQWLPAVGGADVLVDAAHNPAGIRALLEALAADPRLHAPATGDPRPIHCVFSSLGDKPGKDHAAMLRQRVNELYLCPIPIRRGLTGRALADLDRRAPVFGDVPAAIAAAVQGAKEDGGIVLITGSIFLLSEALGFITGAQRDPPVAF